MRDKLIRVAVTASFIAGVAGCAAMSDVRSVRAINAAFDRRDEGELEKMCSGEIALASEKNRESACAKLEVLRGPKAVQRVDCEHVVAHYDRADKREAAFISAAARRMAECGQYTYMFEHVIHWGNSGEGAEILIKLEEEGLPLEAEYGKYLAAHKGPEFFVTVRDHENDVIYGLGHITKWLVTKGHTQHCAAIAESATGASATARTAVLEYFKEAKCKEGVPVAVDLMLDDSPNRRAYACEILGSIGDASVLEKVKTLSETDGHSTVQEEEREGRIWATKVYPVRDACLEAYGKIKLRSN